MKIRMSGNSIRLRLSQSEVSTFLETGEVRDRVHFGTEAALDYALKRSDTAEISTSFDNNCITVLVPTGLGDAWATSEQEVGMEQLHRFSIGENGALRILIEKDFKCVADRQGEDESDNFPNPNLSC